MTTITPHVAVPLTDATRPIYQQLFDHKAQWRAETEPERKRWLWLQVCGNTAELWKVARNARVNAK